MILIIMILIILKKYDKGGKQSCMSFGNGVLTRLDLKENFFNKVNATNVDVKVSEAKKEINKIFSKLRFVKKNCGY